MRRRFFAPLALAAAVITGASGCTLSAEIANLQPYDPSDGVSADVGDLALRNILLIKNDQGDANLVMTVVNNSGENVSLNVQFDGVGSRTTESLAIADFPARTRIGDVPEDGIIMRSPDLEMGGLFPVYFEYGAYPGELVLVPVLDGSLAEYELLVP